MRASSPQRARRAAGERAAVSEGRRHFEAAATPVWSQVCQSSSSGSTTSALNWRAGRTERAALRSVRRAACGSRRAACVRACSHLCQSVLCQRNRRPHDPQRDVPDCHRFRHRQRFEQGGTQGTGLTDDCWGSTETLSLVGDGTKRLVARVRALTPLERFEGGRGRDHFSEESARGPCEPTRREPRDLATRAREPAPGVTKVN